MTTDTRVSAYLQQVVYRMVLGCMVFTATGGSPDVYLHVASKSAAQTSIFN